MNYTVMSGYIRKYNGKNDTLILSLILLREESEYRFLILENIFLGSFLIVISSSCVSLAFTKYKRAQIALILSLH